MPVTYTPINMQAGSQAGSHVEQYKDLPHEYLSKLAGIHEARTWEKQYIKGSANTYMGVLPSWNLTHFLD